MESRYVFILILLLVIFDAIAVNGSFILWYVVAIINAHAKPPGFSYVFIILVNVSWMIAVKISNLYNYRSIQTFKKVCKKTLIAFICQALILSISMNIFRINVSYSLLIPNLLALQLIFLAGTRIFIYLAERNFKLSTYKKKIAIFGHNETGKRLANFFQENKQSFNFKGHFSYLSTINTEKAKLSELKNCIKFAIENHLDEVYSTLFPEESEELSNVITLAEQNCVRIKFVTTFTKYKNEREIFNNLNYNLKGFYAGFPILVTRQEPLNSINNRMIKRLFDIGFSLFVIIFLLSWLVPIISLLIKLESPGPTIFMQLRSGRNNKPFWCYKFRSMRVNDKSNEVQATKNDARVTRIGAFMRRTSIDELPQFFNVLLGNMSVVGPRPHMLKHTEEYRLIIDQYMVRHFLKPGITGWAQVNGHRGETKDHRQMHNRVEHDIWYMENWSITQDIKIIYQTVANAAKGEENAY